MVEHVELDAQLKAYRSPADPRLLTKQLRTSEDNRKMIKVMEEIVKTLTR